MLFNIKTFINKNLLLLSFVIVFIAFVFSRFLFFFYCPIVGFGMDTLEYTRLLEQMLNGNLMNMEKIPGGYPLFLLSIYPLSWNVLNIVIIQNTFSLITSLFLVYTFYKFYRKTTLFAAFAMAIFIQSFIHFKMDTSILTESIYTNSIILFTSLVIWTFKSNKKTFWILLSLSIIPIIFIRTTGLMMIPIFFTILFYLIIKKYKRNIIYSFVLPFVSILIMWSTYNYYSTQLFTIGYPKFITKVSKQFYERFTGKYTLKTQKIILKKYGSLNIKKEPFIKALPKHFLKNMFIISDSRSYYNILYDRCNYIFNKNWIHQELIPGFSWFIASEPLKKLTFKEYYNTENVLYLNHKFENLKNSKVFKINDFYFEMIYNKIFRNIVWVFLYTITFIISFFNLFNKNSNNINSFIIFIICCIQFSNLSLLAFTNANLNFRYQYPTEFINYLSLVFIIILFDNNIYFNKYLNPIINKIIC